MSLVMKSTYRLLMREKLNEKRYLNLPEALEGDYCPREPADYTGD